VLIIMIGCLLPLIEITETYQLLSIVINDV
jgi:hypothetical protein